MNSEVTSGSLLQTVSDMMERYREELSKLPQLVLRTDSSPGGFPVFSDEMCLSTFYYIHDLWLVMKNIIADIVTVNNSSSCQTHAMHAFTRFLYHW